ncbi:MAG: hypothetical protein H7Z43_08565 [Clostridia bacterium]|nr:hypothetical protein [Deltaproteobacteria bacterium]
MQSSQAGGIPAPLAAPTNDPPPGYTGYKRRLVPIVDARFQWKYTLLIAALGVGVTSVMGGFLYRAHVSNTRVLELADEALRLEVARNDQVFLLYLVLLVVGMAVVLAVWGLVVTHRISGPLYLVARYLGVLGGGQYPDLRPLRKRDELQEFFNTFEEAVNAMKARDHDAMTALDNALAAASQANDSDAAARILADAARKQRDVLARALAI